MGLILELVCGLLSALAPRHSPLKYMNRNTGAAALPVCVCLLLQYLLQICSRLCVWGQSGGHCVCITAVPISKLFAWTREEPGT